jgi:hypothetical protein
MSLDCKGHRLPSNDSYVDTIKFLTWEQFPLVLEQSIRFFATLPSVGNYKQTNPGVQDFKKALLTTSGRDFTLAGVGSLIDYDKFGLQIKRPTPQLSGTGCNANSLCLEPVCFGFTEGVIESNNILQSLCWSLSMPCLKDEFYSDAQFDNKMERYFAMFFKQAPAVLEAYQRTRLLKEAVKVICTDKNFRFSGSVIGGTTGISLPFYINPTDAVSFPDISAMGANVGGANLKAFANFVAPRLFTGSFSRGMEDVVMYALESDYAMAKEQTMSVMDYSSGDGMLYADRQIDASLGKFVEDPMFPTFALNATTNQLDPIPYEILEPSTIYGYVQVSNPAHALAQYRGILFVPQNWKFNLVEPPRDDFSSLGLGDGLNFRMNTPGVFPLMSSSMFSRNTIGEDGVVVLGDAPGPRGMNALTAQGLVPRDAVIREAVRTELLMTYTTKDCSNAVSGQLPNVGMPVTNQGPADGFALKSKMYIGSDVRGTARPVLLLFKTDTPRSARPIEVCSVVDVTVSELGSNVMLDAQPGGQIYLTLTFRDAVTGFSVNNSATYRTGAKGASFVVTVTAISGNVVTIQAADGTTLLPRCTGSPDDYGVRGELIKNTGVTNKTSEIMKSKVDTGTSTLYLELYKPIAATIDDAVGTITLSTGQVVNIKAVGANGPGVFLQVETAGGETCPIATLDCACLVDAILTMA